MITREVRKGIYGIILNDWDRRLFDALIPLPDGTSYNSYVILGDEKNVLVDTADPSKTDKLFSALSEIGIERIDYVVSNHSEQDHSGSIPAVLERFPGARVITSAKGIGLLNELLLIPRDRMIEVKDGESLSIGGRTIKFFNTPWVHWPETIVTYCCEEKILFSCDLFGSHLATSSFYASRSENLHTAAKRYYAEIMMPFRGTIKKHLKLIEGLEIELIAPSHGPVHDRPSFITDAYRDWVSDSVKNEVVIPYVSMHGSIAASVDFFIDQLARKNVEAKPFNLPVTDTGSLAMALVDAATVVLGAPTVLAGPHPSALYAAYLFRLLRPKTRFISVIGSFAWGGNMIKSIEDIVSPLKVEMLEPVMVKGYPENCDFDGIKRLVSDIEKRHKELTAR